MKKYVFLNLFIFLSSALFAQEKNIQSDFSLQNGDLIFQESCSGTMNKAIKEVTRGIKGYNFTHVGMVWIDSLGVIKVIEATTPRVTITLLQEYLIPEGKEDCPPKSVVGRLHKEYQPLIPQAVKEALKEVGKEYDYAFDLKNEQYYCSELIYLAFYRANYNKEVFPLNIMTFKSEQDKDFLSYWKDHFTKLGIPIPEGELGINPGAMSQSDLLDIVYYYE